jgi:hypothetical protein
MEHSFRARMAFRVILPLIDLESRLAADFEAWVTF